MDFNGVPPDWAPGPEHQVLATSLGVDLATEAAAFRAYPRTEAIRIPARAFTGWLKNSTPRQNGNGNGDGQKPKPQTEAERNLAKIEAFRQASPGGYARLEKYLAQHKWWNSAGRGFQLEQLRQAIDERDRIFEHLGMQ